MSGSFLFLNGSVRGASGNTQALFEVAKSRLPAGVEAQSVVLSEYGGSVQALADALGRADALVFGTGVYWGSWGSPLQRFLEVMTSYELTPCFLGKPAGALVSADSVGGADVAHRLLGALNWFGCSIPPLASVVVSRVGLSVRGCAGFEDVFQPDDIGVLFKNLLAASNPPERAWTSWGIARTPKIAGPYPQAGPLPAGLPRIPF